MIPRSTKRQRLARAGFVQVSEWLPFEEAEIVWRVAARYREDVERIAETEGKPGRPAKEA